MSDVIRICGSLRSATLRVSAAARVAGRALDVTRVEREARGGVTTEAVHVRGFAPVARRCALERVGG
eukprot:CAMPEP_0174866090 /NCGR_PEP_ID=MMETSP1114-20130205/61501_1 /TAXON_ID=312471 /ORGANISM="Neobodo designis, Strain CCAP 1951/1" /LENGTH=66 /DNA_ID=CAMNT_0016101233 /DNA_START=11 /DNA_END=208 /DNA_ORIENTATION=+